MSFCILQRHYLPGLSGHDDRLVKNVSTVDECIRICIHETSFVCRTVEYCASGRNNERCFLSVDNSASVFDVKLVRLPGVTFYDLFENISGSMREDANSLF